ncbi:L-asparaginase 2 [Actinobacillus pleuropneumoniae]|uniref:asparaginase n=2 Tax=Actinobacillus pleuropneumoniae TaxID=715 RepID=A0A380VV79_ACTPL|nr:L-asparaginase 2 [Actinobacillus pleuropneumoniae]EFL79574.1 L-asparaginase II [Actinobacillus pleuropneumoniae serovar 2 str. 4226]EFL81558.1 L-asparaginase II [Actinobacillus pleuropneumoniae serovar 6 str. Femo]EFM88518.1 L-asparaginase 2 [Actinobacillus pleuropneumoniae serovar 2 str. S1536]EFM92867.1 L-asparaginase 2 [Actinobacillus pleuropneumoniae serovar 6 str. Femo]EFN01454.1 L-asparaginase 2 [Actinobacillus pleuropneumoniae serovar 12 str. 1096]
MKLKKLALSAVLSMAISSVYAAELPNITILATGGTIAGSGQSAVSSAYQAGQLNIDTLIEAVPEMKTLANIKGEQVVKIGSQDMSDEVWLKLAKTVNSQCANTDGFVITHGTDTMEETAYFLDMTVKCDKPVVLVGAMRPATEKSADGPLNLYNSIVVAKDKKSAKRGVLVAMNDVVLGARDVTKTSTTAVQTFSSPNFGTLGYIHNSKVDYERAPESKHTLNTPFTVDKLNELPKVGIIYAYSNMPTEPLKALLDAGYQGIVVAGVGNGNMNAANLALLEQAAKNGVAVVRSSRVPTGYTTRDAEVDDSKYGFAASGTLNPQKARVLLQLALTQTKDINTIQQYFEDF